MPGPFLLPVRGNPAISCSYTCHRNRKPPSSNPGTDWRVPTGTPVYAPMDAVVTRVSHVANQPQGKHVWLRDPRDGAELQMMHFSEPLVFAGQRLAAGQLLAKSGNTGHSTGPHLHVSLWFGGRTLDFMDYVGGSSAGGGGNTIITNEKDEDMDFFNLQGQSGSHSAGLFGAYRGNADGKLYARRLTKDILGSGSIPTIPKEALPAMRATMIFIDLF